MAFSMLSRLLLPLSALLFVPACGGGDDGGDGDGDGATGGASMTGGASSGGTSTGGESTGGMSSGGTGGGEKIDASGTITLDFDGTPASFDVWQADDGGIGFIIVSDSTNSEAVDAVDLHIDPMAVGTFDCGDGSNDHASISVQAEGSNGNTTIYDNLGTDQCTITVTEYGAVGMPVRGTFSAVLMGSGNTTVDITNGSFDIVRGFDP